MIYTSNFSKSSRMQNAGFTFIAITLKSPYYFKGPAYRKLAPSWDILKEYLRTANQELYTQRYRAEILDNLDPAKVITELQAHGDNVVLLCYEKADSFCHRHLVARWLETHSDLRITEL